MRKGSIEISFGMIFSIIIIVSLIGVAVYGITVFLQVGKTAEMGLFYEEFQKTVDEIWSSATTNRVVDFSIPSGIDSVCFGSIANSIDAGRYTAQLKSLRTASSGFQQQNSNTFLYPPEKAKDFAFKNIGKIDTSSLGTFDCFTVQNRKVSIRLSKGEFESLVKVQRP